MPPPKTHRLPSAEMILPPFFVDPSNRNASPIEEVDDEDFKPSSEVNLDQTLSPGGSRTTDELARLITTPRVCRNFAPLDFDSPDVSQISELDRLRKRVEEQDNELKELNDFVRVESLVNEDHRKLISKLEVSQALNEELQTKIDDLTYSLEEAKLRYEENLKDVKFSENEKKKALEKQTIAESTLAGIEMEYEAFKAKNKQRIDELIASLDEARSSKCDESQKSISDEDLKMKIIELEQKLSEAQQEIDKLSSVESQSTNEEMKDLKLKLKSLEEADSLHVKTVSDLKSQIKQLTNDYDETSNQLMDKVEDIDNLQKQIALFTDKYEIVSKLAQKFTDESIEVPVCDNFLEDETINNLLKFMENSKSPQTDSGEEIQQLHENISKISAELLERDSTLR